MNPFFLHLLEVTAGTVLDVLPIVVILFVFQALVIRKKPPNLKFLNFLKALLLKEGLFCVIITRHESQFIFRPKGFHSCLGE